MKFMNVKRFGSIAMAGALTMSLAAPAFATSNNTTNIEGAYKEIPISVVVPTTGTAQINPYGLPITLTKSNESTVNLVGQQVTTRPLSIKNTGDVALDVFVKSFLVVPKGDVEIDSTAGTDKTIAVTLEVAGLDDAKYALSAENEGLEDLLIDAFADDDTWTGAGSVGAPTANKGDTAADISAASDSNAMTTLGAATVGDTIKYGNDSIALFRLTGNVAQDPKDTNNNETPWAETDGFTATVVFKFTPASTAATTYTVTATPTGNQADDSFTVDTANAAAGDTVTITATLGSTSTTVTTPVVTGASGTVSVTAGANNTWTFTMPAEDVTVTATFS